MDPGKNVFLGEFGSPEKRTGKKSQRRLSELMARTVLDWDARWAVYWQLYDNEENGWWLIRPDGSKTAIYRYFQERLSADEIRGLPRYRRIDIEFDRLPDDLGFKCAEFELRGRDTGESLTFDIGEPLKEPAFWRGVFWTGESSYGTFRWFGGAETTTIFVEDTEFADASELRVYGHPAEEEMEAKISVDGVQTGTIDFHEKRWRDWTVTLQ